MPGAGGRGIARRRIIAVQVEGGQPQRQPGHRRFLLGAVDQQDRLRIGDQPVQLGRRHPPVQRHQDRAEPGAAEQQLEKFDAVAGQDRDPVPLRHAPRRQQRGRLPGPPVERGISERPAGRRVLERDPVPAQGRALGEQIGDVDDHGTRVLRPSETRSMAPSATCSGVMSSFQMP